MGVTGLWTVLQPCARPIKIETLNKKRLAVDASIWIYQFLKAVRDKEGNALRNSHIVGFFRRICKLLFFGIKPVFVFDGGAPALKRQTITNRKSRREGRREDAVRTAGKLLAIQMQRAAEEEEKKRKEDARHPREQPEEDIPENLVYASEIMKTQEERLRNRTFKRKDQYHLPDLGASLAEMGGQNDPRIMSLEELEEYARHFDRGEDINVYDFSKIDFDSPFFVSLPASDRYNILNAARLRSRLRLGYSKDQLDAMFPDRMAFSKFQIERVTERNELTQRLMNINGMNDDQMFGVNGTGRVAGEKGREYVLVKNDGVEGGWALGVVEAKEGGKAEKPIDVDRLPRPDANDEEWEEEDEFEDVPIEGLNRLPKRKGRRNSEDLPFRELSKRRQKFYNSRKGKASGGNIRKAKPVEDDANALFVAEDKDEDEKSENVEDPNGNDLFEEPGDNDEEQQLQQAIALSLGTQEEPVIEANPNDSEDDAYREVFQQERVQETAPFSKGPGIAIARQANQRSSKLAKANPFAGSDSEDDDMDLQAALAESRKSKRSTSTVGPRARMPPRASPVPSPKPVQKLSNASGFDGPLPFEKLNLGNSLLGQKKMQKLEEDSAGGFVVNIGEEKKNQAEPLPPWFEGNRDLKADLVAQDKESNEEWEKARKNKEQYAFQDLPRLRKHDTQDVIDLEAPSTQDKSQEVIAIDSEPEEDNVQMEDVPIEDPKDRMGDLADKIRADPPPPLAATQRSPPRQDPKVIPRGPFEKESEDEPVDWSESEPENEKDPGPMKQDRQPTETHPAQNEKSPSPEFEDVPVETASRAPNSPTPEFEDVPITKTAPSRPAREPSPNILQGGEDLDIPVVPYSGTPDDTTPLDLPENDSDQYSDPEDADLFASLAAEGEEHARFAQELNDNKTARINFEEELKQLRAQQKKDRRDADEVTQTMIAECQHLLTLFGLPYITAPMEAEAQCAELVHLGLVDGIVTDDSDTFLFGGTRVYKNMFNAAKFVECYLTNDLVSEFSLTREKLIAIAQLLGSDYTTGIPGIGPVTALEILSEFKDLQDFKDWWSGVQEARIPKDADKNSAFRRRFRRTQTTKLFLPVNFPDTRVAEAYLEPDVDSDPQPFQWGVPDLDALRQFLSNQIGWSPARTDEVLVPVIKDMNRREKEGTQANITQFFDGTVGAGAFAPRVRDDQGGPNGSKKGKGAAGKRLGAALTRLADREKNPGTAASIAEEADGEGSGVAGDVQGVRGLAAVTAEAEKGRKKKAGKKRKVTKASETGTGPGSEEFEVDEAEDDAEYAEPRKKAKRGRRAKVSA